MTILTANNHITTDSSGRAWISGTKTRVLQVAMDKYAHGWSAEEINRQHPHLTMGQIHAALSYYYDHQAELDAEMEREWQMIDEMRKSAPPSKAERKLRQAGLIP